MSEPRTDSKAVTGPSPLPLVGKDGSGGWLDDFKRFLSAMSGDNGMAFLLVPHLEPNRVYLVPPSNYLSVIQGFLRLQEPPRPPGRQTAIDHFLRALGQDCEEKALVDHHYLRCIQTTASGTIPSMGWW